MASKKQTMAAAAGAAALFGTATFVTSAGSSGNLRATVRSSNRAAAEAPSTSKTGFQLTATAAACVMAAQGRKAVTASKHQVTLTAFENELGVQAPVGFWDPVGFTSDGDVAVFKRRRSVELKHGRISMMATMGYITPEVTGKLPGFLSPSAGLKFADIPNGLAAISKVPVAGWAQIAAYFGFVEFSGGFDDYKSGTPGDYGFKVLTSSDPEEETKKLSAELANGRLAMMAIIGMFFQDGLTGSAWGDWANYTASPLRAFENEMGAQPPFGFWDPVGFTADGDVDAYKRRRQTEIKHGRIAMLATMGYMTPEITGKWPGFLSPSAGLKFEDVPNGLAAISKVPVEGWAQILGWMAFCETSKSQAPGTPGAVGDFGWKLITSDDPVVKERKLASELANGRLAMVAIMGMFFQDGLTGSAFGDFAIKQGSAWLAFENELGVQAPVGFWDPAGFTADGSVENFKRRRQTELKHGRISMLATMGYITPEITGKFPGYLSPSAGLKFADVPNGLAAISKVPAAGDFGFKVLTSSDPAEKTKKLSAELANGRLAMMAIIGMFFQDGLTGSAWGDWANYTASPLRAFENELGVQAPIGFFDPFGMTKDGDMEAFKRRRATELKNGRVAMLATMGYIVPEYFRFPGFCSPSEGVKFADIPNGLAAISKVPAAGWTQWFLFLGLIEKGVYTYDPTRSPGDFKNAGVLGVPNGSTMVPGEGRNRKLNSELANGRLAMMAIIGMFFQDGLTGSAWGDWAQYTDSPLRAFENELGVQAPVGYWDPMGMSKDGDLKTFRRRREAELKNGRVAMFATIGFITPEYFRFPGYLSPAKELKFSDVPNGLAAFSKVPLTGWIQILIFCGMVDFGLYRADDSRDPGDYENAGILGVPNASGPMSDVEGRKRKLNSELANGRLAMVAITGMLFQNGMFGTTGPAMWGFEA
ncbi:unnamed protein product [Cladocopium goreaui]|uniref:Ankyrin repeat domain-containing protein 50 n=1 Tax=Cladocopium goreaui TaxID=2562237 RepID=A0A9P1C8Z8_9DINO|nr:unnamed protein product [Cladocopium goreaui]